jgi:hypothetical protein
MNGNELQNLKDHMVDLIEGSDKLTKVQFDQVKEDVTEIKKDVKENKKSFDEYSKNHYAYHTRWTRKNIKCIIGASVVTIILILSGAAAAIVSFGGGLLIKLF